MKKLYKLEVIKFVESGLYNDSYSVGEHFAFAYSEEQAFNYIRRRNHFYNYDNYREYVYYKYRVVFTGQ